MKKMGKQAAIFVVLIVMVIVVKIWNQQSYANEVKGLTAYNVVKVTRTSLFPKEYEVVLSNGQIYKVKGITSKRGSKNPRVGYKAYVEPNKIIFEKKITGIYFRLKRI